MITTPIENLSDDQLRAFMAAKDRLAWLTTGLIGDDGRALQSATGDPNTKAFYLNQRSVILGFRKLQAAEKCRQMGHSFALAADSLARAALEPATVAAHISTDKWESQSKQGYVLRILDALPNSHKSEIKLTAESKDRLELQTRKGKALINFLAQRDPRGLERGGIYLHEMAHMPLLATILKGAKASTLRGGFIKGCSTHEGPETIFNQIITDAQDEETGKHPYRAWERHSFPWWTCDYFCLDIEAAMREAPKMETADRVEKFGSEAIREEYESASSDQEFREECECEVVDELYSYFTEKKIMACIPRTEGGGSRRKLDEDTFDKGELNNAKIDAVREGKVLIDWLGTLIRERTLRGQWAWGYDVGRSNNPDVLTIGRAHENEPETVEPNLIIEIHDLSFSKKRELIGHMMDVIPVRTGAQDETGIGFDLAEWAMENFPGRAFGVNFAGRDAKSRLVNALKVRMETYDAFGSPRLVLPMWTKMKKQFHKIRKIRLPSGGETYDAPNEGKEHADIFWSIALWNSAYAQPKGNYAFQPEVIQRQPSTDFGGGRIWLPGR